MLATLFSQEGTTLQGFNLRQMDTGKFYSSSLSLSLTHTHTHTHTHTQTMIKLTQKLKLAGQIYEMLPVKYAMHLFRNLK